MSAEEIHVGDVGSVFRVTVKDGDVAVDVSLASSLIIRFKKPDGTTVNKTATLYTDGKDGIIQYTTIAGDLDQSGKWYLQGIVEFSSSEWNTDLHQFRVYSNI